jgi:hypothetical protein
VYGVFYFGIIIDVICKAALISQIIACLSQQHNLHFLITKILLVSLRQDGASDSTPSRRDKFFTDTQNRTGGSIEDCTYPDNVIFPPTIGYFIE